MEQILFIVTFGAVSVFLFYKACKKQTDELCDEIRQEQIRPFDSVRNWDLEVRYLNCIHTPEGKAEVEAECLEVFSELPSWGNVKRWDPLEYDEREAFWAPQYPEWIAKEGERDNELARNRYALRNVHREVAMCVFMANRGCLPQSGLNCCGYEFEAERCGARTSADVTMFASMQKEFLLWVCGKIRSYDIDANLLCHIRPYPPNNDNKEYAYDFDEKTDVRNHPRGTLSFTWEPFVRHMPKRKISEKQLCKRAASVGETNYMIALPSKAQMEMFANVSKDAMLWKYRRGIATISQDENSSHSCVNLSGRGWTVSTSTIGRETKNSETRFSPAFYLPEAYVKEMRPKVGGVYPIGTLYMAGKPVPVAKALNGAEYVEDYIPDSKLEIRVPMDDVNYKILACYIGDGFFISVYNILKNISYEDILWALTV